MERGIGRQAEAGGERARKGHHGGGGAAGVGEAGQAAHIIGAEPAAIQLRYLQTVTEIASENNSTTIFPIPLDLFRAFLEAAGTRVRAGTPALPEKTSGDALPAARSEQKAKV